MLRFIHTVSLHYIHRLMCQYPCHHVVVINKHFGITSFGTGKGGIAFGYCNVRG